MAKSQQIKVEKRQLEFQLDLSLQKDELINLICRRPLAVIWEPLDELKEYSDLALAKAHAYFSQDVPDVHVHSICTQLLQTSIKELDALLATWKFCEIEGKNRFWPFWFAGVKRFPVQKSSPEEIAKYLIGLWNGSPHDPSAPNIQTDGLMINQTGALEISDQRESDGFVFFKCVIPTPPAINQKKGQPERKYCGWFVIAFEISTASFYSMNCKIKCDPPKSQHRYIEIIDHDLIPPLMTQFGNAPESGKWRILLVMDWHIGDNLSLFSTYVEMLSRVKHIDLTINTFRCPFFGTLKPAQLKRFFPGRKIRLVNNPVDTFAYDLVLDPYDLVPGIFTRKPQNDSGQLSIVSALEFARCNFKGKRRDILDMHFHSLMRFGFATPDEKCPDFIRLSYSRKEKQKLAISAKRRILKGCAAPNGMRIVSFFPFGLTKERKYPPQRLRDVFKHLLKNEKIFVVLAGASVFDKSHMGYAISGKLIDGSAGGTERILVYFEKTFADVLLLMLASDIIVAMDSGPLHLARCLRCEPIALYTSKVNSNPQFLAFPWFVDDSTVKQLMPEGNDPHVSSNKIIDALEKGLRISLN